MNEMLKVLKREQFQFLKTVKKTKMVLGELKDVYVDVYVCVYVCIYYIGIYICVCACFLV